MKKDSKNRPSRSRPATPKQLTPELKRLRERAERERLMRKYPSMRDQRTSITDQLSERALAEAEEFRRRKKGARSGRSSRS